MRTWAHWTARTVMLTASLAAAGTGFSGAAFAASGGNGGGAGGITSGLGSVAGGNQATTPISFPVDVCGHAAAVLGLSLAGCEGGASVASSPAASPLGATRGGQGGASGPASGPQRPGTTSVTSGRGSAGGGNQAHGPVSAPASVCGNAAAVLGDSAAGCEGTASVRPAAGARGGRTFAETPETETAPSSADGSAGGPASRARSTAGAGAGQAVPATTLAADSASGMSTISFYSLAIGALVAGAVALKMAGRRSRDRYYPRGRRV